VTEFVSPGTGFAALPSPFPMKRGGALLGARMAYETWGTLNAARDNTVLILTGLSPSAHAARNEGNGEDGWWEAMLGPGKPIDSARWFVVCVNSLGSCKGSTGPASTDPATGAAYRLAFPELSIEDGANAAFEVLKSLGIERIACVIGNSMGGMTALAFLKLHPGVARTHINVSGSARALPFSIAIRSLQREAIRLDPAWNLGNYDDAHYPVNGMRMARKLGVVTYRSAMEWDGRFGRVRLDSEFKEGDDPFGLEFEVERYLEAHARRFVHQFDPNCYLYLSRSMDWFDLAEYAGGDVEAGLASIRVERSLSIGVHTDILFPLQQQQQVCEGLAAGGAQGQFVDLPSPQGHDAFLVDIARFGPVIAAFLQQL
jgi:homoserine O-acetyltransferase